MFIIINEWQFMFVCICNQVTDKEIYRAVEQGISSFESISSELNIGSCCGKCKSCAKKVMREAIQENTYTQSYPAGFEPVLTPA